MNEQIKITCKKNSELELKVIPGHFSSDRFHVNYYIDMSTLKMRQKEAKLVAKTMVENYVNKVEVTSNRVADFMGANALAKAVSVQTPIDTIICMDGCEVIGAYLADELTNENFPTNNKHNSFYVITPEFDKFTFMYSLRGLAFTQSIKTIGCIPNVVAIPFSIYLNSTK